MPDRTVHSDSLLQGDGGWRVFAMLHYLCNNG